MNAPRHMLAVFLVVLLAPGFALAAGFDEAKKLAKYQPAINKGLTWLARHQHKDGHWEATGGAYPVSMTAYAGLAFLGEGSTPKKGKYAESLREAVAWLLARQQADGLIGNPKDPAEALRYMMGHANAVLFLSQVYVKETDKDQRKKLGEALRKAVVFTAAAQMKNGSWGYVSAADAGGDFDEGCSLTLQLHSLFAARQAKVAIPKGLIESAMKYMAKCNAVSKKDDDPKKREAGMAYDLRNVGAGPRHPLTTAAVAALLHIDQGKSELLVPWLNLVHSNVPLGLTSADQFGVHAEYINYYFAQLCYSLGEDRHAKLRPDLAEAEKNRPKDKLLLKWSRYRETVFDQIVKTQHADGGWSAGPIGSVYVTAIYLTILQLDKEQVPYFKR